MHVVYFGFNRTFMEWKFKNRVKEIISISFNRTFMELKLRKLPERMSYPTVLIVPLWN